MSVFYRKMVKSNDFHADAVRHRSELKRNTMDTAARLQTRLARMSASPGAIARHEVCELLTCARILVDNLNVLTKNEFSVLYRIVQNIEDRACEPAAAQASADTAAPPHEMEWLVTRDGDVRILDTRTFRVHSGNHGGEMPSAPVLEGGAMVFPGCASGPAFVAHGDKEPAAAPSGAIVVLRNPDQPLAGILPYMAGLIAEHDDTSGGQASQARELGLPCVFGLLGAIKKIEHGRQIFLDAFQCKVFTLDSARDASSEQHTHEHDRHSPLGDLLFERSTPLSESPDADHCRSVADVAGFVHDAILQYNEISGSMRRR